MEMNPRVKIFSFLIALWLFVSLMAYVVLAEQENPEVKLEIQNVNPGGIFYVLKRGWEKVREKLILSSKDKVSYEEYLLKVRLSEFKYVVDNNLLNEFQTSSERFSYQAGILTDILGGAGSQEKEKIKNDFEEYSKLLEGLRDKHPANSSYWMLVQYDIDTLHILSDKIN